MIDSLPDPESFAAELAKSTRAHVSRALQPLEQTVAKHDVRLDVCDSTLRTLAQKVETIPAGKDGINGKDGADGLNGKDGAPGEAGPPGKDAEIESVRAIVVETLPSMVDKAQRELEERVDAWRPELKGEPGKDGAVGPAGESGRDGKDVEPEVARVIAAEAVTEFVEGFGKALAARFAQADGVA